MKLAFHTTYSSSIHTIIPYKFISYKIKSLQIENQISIDRTEFTRDKKGSYQVFWHFQAYPLIHT